MTGIENHDRKWFADILIFAVDEGVITREQRRQIIQHAPAWGRTVRPPHHYDFDTDPASCPDNKTGLTTRTITIGQLTTAAGKVLTGPPGSSASDEETGLVAALIAEAAGLDPGDDTAAIALVTAIEQARADSNAGGN